jgi:hypothetical protein
MAEGCWETKNVIQAVSIVWRRKKKRRRRRWEVVADGHKEAKGVAKGHNESKGLPRATGIPTLLVVSEN